MGTGETQVGRIVHRRLPYGLAIGPIDSYQLVRQGEAGRRSQEQGSKSRLPLHLPTGSSLPISNLLPRKTSNSDNGLSRATPRSGSCQPCPEPLPRLSQNRPRKPLTAFAGSIRKR